MSEPTFTGFGEVASTTTKPDGDVAGAMPDDVDQTAAGPPGDNSGPPPTGGTLARRRRWSREAGFRALTSSAGLVVLAIIVAIGVFLIAKAIPALNANHANFLTFKNWFPSDTPPKFGIAALAFGTVITSFIALLIAVPIAIC